MDSVLFLPSGRRAERLYPVLFLVLTGCASSQIPTAIRTPPPVPISVSQVQQDPHRFLGRRVRWGGSIIAVRNRKRTTEVEILSRPLTADGMPRGEEPGEGRFIALLTGFADPAELPEKRLLTLTGHLEPLQTRPVGEYPYPYAVVRVDEKYLWPEPLVQPPPPYFYPDPWYGPWYEPWPWYRYY